ncbi:MAG: hypothetical protein R3F39_07345 [Myxococcota bacterium]
MNSSIGSIRDGLAAPAGAWDLRRASRRRRSLARFAAPLAFALLALAACDDGGSEGPALNPVDDDTIEVLAQYPVNGDALVGTVDPAHRAVWERFNELFPAELHPEINLFVAIDAEKSGGTDGAMQLSAVNPADYYLALDVTGSVAPDELDRTMIHEFAHLLTLRPSQVPRNEAAIATCDVFTDSEGCPREGSYLRAYFEEFWPGFLGADLAAEDKETAPAARFATGDFVTEYAATIPTEDIAEVFAEWVKAETSPAGDTVKERKLRFFDAYPELAPIRDGAREALAN